MHYNNTDSSVIFSSITVHFLDFNISHECFFFLITQPLLHCSEKFYKPQLLLCLLNSHRGQVPINEKHCEWLHHPSYITLYVTIENTQI
jgi:hypothetical protein